MNLKQDTGLSRKTIDKYYTAPSVVLICMELAKQYLNIDKKSLCIEPSAGNGSFIKSIQSIFKHYRFYDLEPENPLITKQDYLDFDYTSLIQSQFSKIHVIGNPPFGRQSSLAIKFIKKSSKYCNSISFILPKSFKKDSMKKHFPLNFHLEHEFDLPENSFIVGDKSYNVPCVFQIWIKKLTKRSPPIKLKPKGFSFVKINESPDISFRRVGVYAGKIDIITEGKSPQSHYFIKFDNSLNSDTFDKLVAIDYKSTEYTVGPKSISKQELIKEFNVVLK